MHLAHGIVGQCKERDFASWSIDQSPITVSIFAYRQIFRLRG
jgi:hypothetical protein